jgi:hypothetical protein
MTEQPDLSTLPKRMRYAAEVLREVNKREGMHSDFSWANCGLRALADRWESEDATAAERDALVEELAKGMALAVWNGIDHWADDYVKALYLSCARFVVESGWRKGGSA